MILDKDPWFVSIDPGTCFCLTKSARKSMKALGGRGMYPWERRLPGGHRLRAGGGAGVDNGGKSVDNEVGFVEDEGEGGDDKMRSSSSSGST